MLEPTGLVFGGVNKKKLFIEMNVSLQQWFIVDDVGERSKCNQKEFMPEKRCMENIFGSHFNLSFPHFESIRNLKWKKKRNWCTMLMNCIFNAQRSTQFDLGLDCEMNDDQICKCFSKYLIEMRDRKLYPKSCNFPVYFFAISSKTTIDCSIHIYISHKQHSFH